MAESFSIKSLRIKDIPTSSWFGVGFVVIAPALQYTALGWGWIFGVWMFGCSLLSIGTWKWAKSFQAIESQDRRFHNTLHHWLITSGLLVLSVVVGIFLFKKAVPIEQAIPYKNLLGQVGAWSNRVDAISGERDGYKSERDREVMARQSAEQKLVPYMILLGLSTTNAPFEKKVDIILEKVDAVLAASTNEIQKLKAKISALEPKPFKVRLCAFLDSLDKRIVPALEAGPVNYKGRFSLHQYKELKGFLAEQESRYVAIVSEKELASIEMLGVKASATWEIELFIAQTLVTLP